MTRMEIKNIEVRKLKPDPNNSNSHPDESIDAIKKSLMRFGQQKNIVVDSDNQIVAGEGTWKAAKALGWSTLLCNVTDLKGPDAEAFAIADNRSKEFSSWDREVLGRQLEWLGENDIPYEDLGFSEDDLTLLIDHDDPYYSMEDLASADDDSKGEGDGSFGQLDHKAVDRIEMSPVNDWTETIVSKRVWSGLAKQMPELSTFNERVEALYEASFGRLNTPPAPKAGLKV